MKNIFSIALLFISLTACAPDGDKSAVQSTVVLDESYYTDVYGWNSKSGTSHTLLGRGINMGNFLEAEGGEGAWTGGRLIQESDFAIIKEAGFATVRIPVRWADNTANSSPYTIDSQFMKRVKEVVLWARAADLKVVLNVHHYNAMMVESADLDYHTKRLVSIWDQICDEFPLSSYSSDELVFEPLNEPHTNVSYSDWNTILAEVIDVIWNENSSTQTNDSSRRKIVIGTANWGGVPGLQSLTLPEECSADNTIITVHYYEPFTFTHQGAEWVDGADEWVGTSWLGTEAQQAGLIALFTDIEEWNSTGYEVFMGEFGVYSAYSEPEHQKAWTAFIAREAEKRNISWAYWEFAAGFGAYNPTSSSWRTQLIEALIPVSK